MTNRSIVLLSIVAAAGTSLAAGSSPGGDALLRAGQETPPALERVAWLAGCWRRGGGERQVDEQWMEPHGDAMLGMSRTVRDGRVVEYEYLRIEARADGVYYVAVPSRQSETAFRLSPGDGAALLFENPEHDFPKAIAYAPSSGDSLVATISGDGREIPFPFARVACPGGPR